MNVDASKSLCIHSHVDHFMYLLIFDSQSDSWIGTVLGLKQEVGGRCLLKLPRDLNSTNQRLTLLMFY
jgi:hypothetical protein